MTRKKNRDVPFVTLDDESVHSIIVNAFILRNGDHIACVVAGEWQRGGKIPPGKIVRARGLDIGSIVSQLVRNAMASKK